MMKFRRLLALAFVFCAFVVATLPNVAFAQSSNVDRKASTNSKVAIVSLPRVNWETLSGVETPNIDKLITIGSVASFSVKSSDKNRTLESAYASISSGNRASAVDPSLSTFYLASELVGSRNAGDIFNRERGIKPKPDQIVGVGFERTLVKNSSGLSPASVGSFGYAINKNGKSMSVFGNADRCQKEITSCVQRAVGYLGVNKQGIVRHGNVSRSILNEDLSMNTDKVSNLASRAMMENDLVAVECSDLEKIEYDRKLFTPEILEKKINSAIKDCDELVGDLVQKLDLTKDRIYVLSPVSSTQTDELTVFISAGKGIKSGYASSGITRREGIVALGDIAPSILRFLEIKPPKEMVATLIESKGSSDSLNAKKDKLIDMNNKALSRDSSFSAIAATFGLLAFGSVLVSILAYRRKVQFRKLAKWLSLIVLSIPVITFLLLPAMTLLTNTILFVSVLLFASVSVASIGFYIGEKKGYLYAVLLYASLNIIVLVIDVLLGAKLQLNSIFGYSAIVAGRYAGYGNMAFAILSISSIIFVACIKQLGKDNEKWNKNWINPALLVFLVLILILDGAPFFGSDVGGVFALTPTVFIVSMMLYEKKLGLRSVFISAFLTLGALVVFSIADLNRPVSERTHLGRFVEVLFNGKAGVVIERKIASNLAILTNSTLSTVVLISSLVAIILFLHPERYIKNAVKEYPFFRFLVLPGFVLASLGLLLNDSGAAIPGMMAAIALPTCALIMFEFQTNEKKSQSNTTSVAQDV